MKQTLAEKLKLRFIYFLARRLPPCRLMAPLASDARERPLTLRERITLKLHLFTCEACRRYVAQIEQLSRMVKSPTEENGAVETSPAELSPDARARIKSAIEAAARNKN